MESEAHIYGWVDSNQNGKFDEILFFLLFAFFLFSLQTLKFATITQDGTVEFVLATADLYRP